MATLVSFVVSEARRILRDTRATAQRYTDADYIAALNMGQRMMVNMNADTNLVTTVIQLVAGAKQSTPADCASFKHGVRNMGLSGTAPGRSIVPVAQPEMDAAESGWYNAPVDAEVMHSIASSNEAEFFVYPPQPTTPHQIEVLYTAIPADVAVLGDNISVRDEYASALPYFCAAYLLSQDNEHDASAARAQTYMGSFAAQLGVMPGSE